MIQLTVEDIIAATGQQQCENVVELEILFNTFDEIASLDSCYNLKKLTLLDNGLKKISNLTPVSLTLQSLTLCDQSIEKMENLELPMLRELFLHRNNISEIRGLSGCPRLRKLWLFQNKLTRISGLHSLPELQECWLQANQISQLDGFEHCVSIACIGLAGNPIGEIDQIRKLCGCSNLRDVSFNDIHFGRAPIVDCVGYKEFVVLHLRQVVVVDGIKLSQSGQLSAEDAYFSHVQSFNQSLEDIEDSHLRNMNAIQSQFQSKELHSLVLEKEMASALRELQNLVMNGAQLISKQVTRNQSILSSNYDTLTSKIHLLESEFSHKLRDQLSAAGAEYDASCAVLAVAEYIATAEAALVAMLSAEAQQPNQLQLKGTRRLGGFLFQPIVSSAADFQLIASSLFSASKSSGIRLDRPAVVDSVELVRLYRVTLPSRVDQPAEANELRVFTLLAYEDLERLVKYGWKSVADTLLFSPNIGILTALLSEKFINLRDSRLGGDFLNAVRGRHTAGKAAAGGEGVAEGLKLQSVLSKKVVYAVCCKLNIDKNNLLSVGRKVNIPSAAQNRDALHSELLGCKVPQSILVENFSNDAENPLKGMLFALPNIACEEAVEVDFLSLCITPPMEDGVHTLENKLEMLSLPDNAVDSSRAILNSFEMSAAGEVKQFVNRVLFEIDESQASTLLKAEKEVVLRETALKKLRDEVEKERKMQEAALREMRGNAQFAPESGSAKAKAPIRK